MSQLASILIATGLTVALAACQERALVPEDLHVRTLDPAAAVKESDSIIVAVPLSHRDVRKLTLPPVGPVSPTGLAETETRVAVLQVLKGPPLPSEITYRFYDEREGAQFGPPRGPSGAIGTTALFFLRRQPDATFRAAVDVYRPDIETPWIKVQPEPKDCIAPEECVAEVLLSRHPADDPESFSRKLGDNVAISRRLTTFFKTYDLLNRLVLDDDQPRQVRQAGCSQFGEWYALELPLACESVLVDAQSSQDLATARRNLQERLRKGGLGWARHRIGSESDAELDRYLHVLAKSNDEETRTLAVNLLKETQ